jgi:hypothetical protein
MLVLDPTGINGAPEIVRVTAHAVSSTACTITRATEGTNARAHQQNETWFLAPTRYDYATLAAAAGRPVGDLYIGQQTFDTDTFKPQFWNGTTWVQQGAGGQMPSGYAQSVAAQAGIGAGPTDLTSLTVTVTTPASRRIKISSGGLLTYSDGTTGHVVDVFKDGVATNRVFASPRTATAGDPIWMSGYGIDTPSAGAHTYKLVAGRAFGAGTLTVTGSATAPAFILVEDIGSSL